MSKHFLKKIEFCSSLIVYSTPRIGMQKTWNKKLNLILREVYPKPHFFVFLYYCIFCMFVFLFVVVVLHSAELMFDKKPQPSSRRSLMIYVRCPSSHTQLRTTTHTSHPPKINEQAKWEIRGLSSNCLQKKEKKLFSLLFIALGLLALFDGFGR